MKMLPLLKPEDIIVQNVDKEVLVYDLVTNKAYALNDTSAIVYQNCDGKTSFDELKSKYKFTDDLIYLALDELKKNNLIEADSFVSPFAGVSRREVIRKVGLASIIALPVISSLVAPTAAQAASPVACVNTTGPQRAPNTYLGVRSSGACANDAFTCCSNSTRFTNTNCQEINNVTHQIGCDCYCN